MKPRIKLAEAQAPDGGNLCLFTHDNAFSISLNGQELMHSRSSASEAQLGTLGVEHLNPDQPARVLIGGLGLGFTLKRVLESTGANTIVEVVELIPDVISWNRTHLRELNGSLLEDPRVIIHTGDAGSVIRSASKAAYDGILLDVDNGPVAMVKRSNDSLYTRAGIQAVRSALKADGRAVFWSASHDHIFADRLKQTDFSVQAIPSKAHENAKRATYLIYVADRDSKNAQDR